MNLSVLSQASAFNPGSDLWIMPDLEKSNWTAKLDWYLNFQICKSSRHVSLKLSSFVTSVLNETGLEEKQAPKTQQDPLMIASERLLPNKWVVIIPWNNDASSWAKQSFEVWQKLKEPSLRIFLPPGQRTGSLESAWHNNESFQDFTVVLD
ncbi:MAG: hypothetical protein ACXVCY_16215 [Pseudobdellovibrionaceae bacterium]